MEQEKEHDCKLVYKLAAIQNQLHAENNELYYEEMVEKLYAVGVHLWLNNGKIYIFIDDSFYERARKRGAGRRKRIGYAHDGKMGYTSYRYSDVIVMMQSMTASQIQEKINMPSATYFRHKKAMMASEYYKAVDKNRLNDLDYLTSVEGNYLF